jgi:hypothetical protein
MTLLEVIKAIEDAAARQPSVAMIVENDIFRLNSYADARYGVFAWTQGRHRVDPLTTPDFIRYNFTFFYVDRLRNDKANQVEVQSVGIETIQNVLRTLRDAGLDPETYEFTTFNQRFADECAGVFCSVILLTDTGSACAETEDGGFRGPDGWEQAAPDVIIRKF